MLHCLRCLHSGRGSGRRCIAWRDRAQETRWAACRGLGLLCGRSSRPFAMRALSATGRLRRCMDRDLVCRDEGLQRA
eukprot:1264668-Alexandrium_andersonii.AAC.1